MARQPAPRSASLLKWLKRHTHLSRTVAGEYYRFAGPIHTTSDEILSGLGAFKSGGRWNPIGTMRVVSELDSLGK